MKIKGLSILLSLVLSISFLITGCSSTDKTDKPNGSSTVHSGESSDAVPEYSGQDYITLSDNIPEFTEDELTTGSFENYSELDGLGRCGVAFACVGVDIMPTEDREGIGQIKPSGWVTAKYDIVDGKYLYNRCHLIGFQLTGENANEKNLITGTRYFNVEGMLPFENMVADYVKETKNHVLYRVTPVFVGEDLVAKGVQMEAYSVEDDGEGVCFNVFVYNIQPGITINYANGQSALNGEELPENPSSADSSDKADYILNTNSMKFHDPDCGSVKDMKDHNKQEYSGSRDALIADGYEPCGSCKP